MRSSARKLQIRFPARKICRGWWLYLAMVHLILIIAIFRHDLVERGEQIFLSTPVIFEHYQGMVAAQQAQIKCMPENRIVFIGNSIIYGLDVKTVISGNVMNFGIGGDNTEGVLWRISHYSNLNSARAIIVSIGINDLCRFDDDRIISNYKQILKSISATPIIISCILPVNERLCKRANISYLTGLKLTNNRIKIINRRLKDLCLDFPNVTYIDAYDWMSDETGNLIREYTADGVHLNPQGYDAWIHFLGAHIDEILNR